MDVKALRCPFKIELVGVVFQCDQRFGHWGQCYNEPEGCGGDVRITFRPSEADKVEEMAKMLRDSKVCAHVFVDYQCERCGKGQEQSSGRKDTV